MIDTEKLLDEIIAKLDLINADDIPSIDLYMDQVTTFMDTHLKCRKRYEDDKILTKTMINNYAKNSLLPSPEKKRYSKEHVIMLIFIYYLKNMLSINDIKTILNPLSDKYFNKDSSIALEDIYSKMTDLETSLTDDIRKDIKTKIDDSKEQFSDAPNKDKQFLQLFSLITSLTYDVYIKKQMIEGIVDMMAAEQTKSSDKGKSKEKK